jgi:hypothetical protein
MIMRTIAVRLLGLAMSGWAVAVSAQPVSPYAGQHSREIKALSPKEIDDLVLGRGMGLAKPAELNRYPGPLHALELAGELQLSAEQRNSLEASKARMSARARALGAEILDLERELDAAFAQRAIDQVRLSELTAQIGAKQGMLRAAHLEAHIETAGLLTLEQISRYDILRGYGRLPSAGQDGRGTKHH